jgi:pimeloyl-ACP methyl ester carboxylesterase
MIIFLIAVILALAALITFICLLIHLISWLTKKLRKKESTKNQKRLVSSISVFAVLVLILVCLAIVTQLAASTPPIRDSEGNRIDGSIAELRKVSLNGRTQWISIRGRDKTKPVLLFLAGGPGGSQMAAVRHDLSGLEESFVVVNWDQPGSGKSYYAEKLSKLTPETYIQDGYALTLYLREAFNQDKIYLVGESWGSALGIFLIDRHPEVYHAFIGTGQMVDFAETERIDYLKALQLAEKKNDSKTAEKLKANGLPPYYGKDVTFKSAVYLNYLSSYMTSNPEIHNSGYSTFRDVFSSEYGLIDKINYFRGIINTFNCVYQQLYDIDLASDYTDLSVPVYFFEGRHDLNAPIVLVEEYFSALNAPVKELVWFEHSGHSPWINESGKFIEELLLRFNKAAETEG